MRDLKIKGKLHKPCVWFACIHFVISFFTDRLIFTYSLCDFTSLTMAAKSLLAIGSKIAFFFVLVLLWQGLYYFVKKADRRFVRYTLIYFAMMCILLLLTYPGIFRMDEFSLLFGALDIYPVFWQNYLTSVFYIFSLMLIPTPAGVILMQCVINSLVVGYLIYKIEALGVVKGRWIYAVYLPFVLFPVLDSNLYPMRMSVYAFLELCLLMKLVFFRLEKKEPRGIEFVTMIILSALVIVWRSEAIYYLIAIPVCFVCMLGKYTDKKVKMRFILWLLITVVVLYIPQKLGDKVINGNQYELTGMLLPVVPLVDACVHEVQQTTDSETKTELEGLLTVVDRVLNVELMVEEYAKGKNGINMFWSMPNELQRKYTDTEFTAFKGVYTKLIVRYPLVFLKERVQTFFESEDLLENTTVIFDNTGVKNHEQLSELFLAKPINKELRKSVISVLELRDRADYNRKLTGYSVVYHVILPLIFLVGLLVVLCLKRKWGYALLLASHLCKVPLIFLTAPSRLFMYYYPVYLTGAFVVVLLILKGLSNRSVRENL